MWVRRWIAVVAGFATALVPAASWAAASSRSAPRRGPLTTTAVSLPFARSIVTFGIHRREASGACGDAANAFSIDITPATTGMLRAATAGARAPFDPVLILRDDRGRVVACNDDASAKTVESRLAAKVSGGRHYVLEVGGQAGTTGRSRVTATLDPSPATVHGTASISGVVRSRHDGKGINGICVTAYNSFNQFVSRTFTALHGAYRLTHLPPAHLRVGFSNCRDPHPAYQDQYWNGRRTLAAADPITTHNGGNVGHIDANLAEYGTIAGTAYDAAGKHPLGGICVQAQTAITAQILQAVTSVTGTYRIQGADTGWYSVSFHDCFSRLDADEWWNGTDGGVADPGAARPMHVDRGQSLSGIDARLRVGGAITGTIRDAATGQPVPGACVKASAPDRPNEFAPVDAAGRYRIAALATGSYTVFFADCARRRLSSQYWQHTGDPALATRVTVKAAQDTRGINASLPHTGSVAGTVVDERDGQPLGDVCVTARGTDLRSARTDAAGRFKIKGLSVGPYVVSTHDCGFGRRFAYLDTFYPNTTDSAAAEAVPVKSAAATVVTLRMVRSGAVRGVLTTAGNHPKPIVGVCVALSTRGSPDVVAEARTGVTGAYRVVAPPGSYVVRFSACGADVYRPAFWDGASARSDATPVTVKRSHDTANINGTLTRGATISGHTFAPFDDYRISTCVDVRTGHSPGRIVREVLSRWDGSYRIGGLEPGRYRVQFGQCHDEENEYFNYYAPTYYADAATFDDATVLVVDASDSLKGIDGSLDYGATITGALVSAVTHEPVDGVCVEAIGTDPAAAPVFTEAYGGQFYLSGLPPDDYHLRFGHEPEDAPYRCGFTEVAISWYPKAPDEASSTTVHLDVHQFRSNVNGVVYEPGQVTGYVTAADTGQKIAEPCGVAYSSSGAESGRPVTVGPGLYAVTDLPPDTYRVLIADCGSRHYGPRYFDGVRRLANATPVPIAKGEVRSDIGAILHRK